MLQSKWHACPCMHGPGHAIKVRNALLRIAARQHVWLQACIARQPAGWRYTRHCTVAQATWHKHETLHGWYGARVQSQDIAHLAQTGGCRQA